MRLPKSNSQLASPGPDSCLSNRFSGKLRELKNRSLQAFARNRYPLAMLAGLLLACAFPKFGIAGFGWIAPGALLAVALGTTGKQSFRLGYVAGLTHYLVSLYWLLCIPVRGFPILGWIALSAFLALYPAAWVWLSTRAFATRTGASLSCSSDAALPNWNQRTLWALSCAAFWVAWEMIVARFLGGFPWNLLGASQYRLIPLIQISSVTGVYGVSFLLVWSSISLLNAVRAILLRPQFRSVWIGEIALPMLVVGAVFAFGFHQLHLTPTSARELNVTLVQPSIPQTMIWDEAGDMERFRTLIHLSEQALTNKTDLLIWPEAAIPGMLRYNTSIREPILQLARAHKIWIIVGSDDAEPRKNSNNPNDADYFNSSFLISPEGRIINRYRKRNLVIFGEYIPLEHSLPFIKCLTPITGSFTPGDKAVPFQMGPATTSVLICFEDNFPHLVREYANDNTDFLVNLTNNGWFGESAAQWQHAANSIFRAVENGLPLVRCSNNGLTCWVDANGRIQEIFRDSQGTIYGAGFLAARIPLLEPDQNRSPTFYNRHGDWFGWSCVVWTSGIGFRIWRGRKHGRTESGSKS